jgi:hypothetical protein
VKPKVECARVIDGSPCGRPKNHPVHGGSGYEHEYRRPERKVRREAMAAHSDKMQRYYDEERIPEVQAIQGAQCEVRISDRIAVGPRYQCTGYAVDIHEVIRRSQAGSLQKAVEYGTLKVCRPCHRFISERPAMARELGLSMSLKDLPK